MLEACTELGFDPTPLRDAAGLGATDLDDPEARIPFVAEQAVWAGAFQATGDAALALRAARHVRGEDYRVLMWLGRHSPTVGEALQRVARWFALVTPQIRFELDLDGASPALVFTVPGFPPPLPRPMVDYTLAVTYLRMREATQEALTLLRVDVPYPAPEDDAGPELHGCPVRHASTRAALVLTQSGWDRPVPGADGALSRILEEHAALLMEKVPRESDFLDDVKQVVAVALPDGAPSVRDAGKALGMSGRTLQRRLGECDVTWSKLVDEVRLQLATLHLADPAVSLAEVAFLLGFSEQSAFTRAFKRWTGQTPAQSRRGATLA